MPFQKTEAVVLNSIDYGESDKIVTFYTVDYGKIKGIAKGARKSKKRFVNSLEPFSHVKLGFFKKEKRELVRIDYCDLIDSFPGIKESIERIAFGSSFMELLSSLTGEEHKNLKAFILLLRFLHALQGAGDFKKSMPLYELRLVSIFGYRPSLNACVLCNSKVADDVRIMFSVAKGGVVCIRCRKDTGSLQSVSGETIRAFRNSLKVESVQLAQLSLDDSGAAEARKLLREFITHQLGKSPQSWKFIDDLAG
jgi:DNA repair protein RecO (recombination protein O)